MTRGKRITSIEITAPAVGECAAVAAAGVCSDRELWKNGEIVDMYMAATEGREESFPLVLAGEGAQLVVKGLLAQVNTEGDTVVDAMSRLQAYACLRAIGAEA